MASRSTAWRRPCHFRGSCFWLRTQWGSSALLIECAGDAIRSSRCLMGAALKTDANDLALLRRYFEQRVARRREPTARAYYEARHRLPS